MADTTDPQLAKFANERVRTIADKLTSLVLAAQSFQTDYAAFGIAALITAAGNTNTIGDGSATDGRQRITGLQIQNLKAAIDQLVTSATVTAVTGVGATPAFVSQAIQVNGSAR